MDQKYYVLNNGYKIPAIAFGTFQIPDGKETQDSVYHALQTGYRHIDGAAIYKNEKSVGEAIKKADIDRRELFVTSKLWNADKGYDQTMAAFHTTLEDLQLEYLDLYLIHWPIGKMFKENWQEANNETWRAFEDLYKAGKIKALGVSNFMPHHLRPLLEYATIKPMVNQIEFHPSMLQEETVSFCREHNIYVEAWAPLAKGKVSENEVLIELGKKYGKTPSQVTLRWILQKDMIALPKSVTPKRIEENLDVFDFNLSQEDMNKIDAITDCPNSGLHPDHISF